MSSLLLLDMQRLLVLVGAFAALGALAKRGLLRRHWPVAVIAILWAADTILAKGWPCLRTREVYIVFEALVAASAFAHAWRLGIPDVHLGLAAMLCFLSAAEAIIGHGCNGFYRPVAFLDAAAVICLTGTRRWWIAPGQDAVAVSATWGLGLMLSVAAMRDVAWEFGERFVNATHLGVVAGFLLTMFLVARAALARIEGK